MAISNNPFDEALIGRSLEMSKLGSGGSLTNNYRHPTGPVPYSPKPLHRTLITQSPEVWFEDEKVGTFEGYKIYNGQDSLRIVGVQPKFEPCTSPLPPGGTDWISPSFMDIPIRIRNFQKSLEEIHEKLCAAGVIGRDGPCQAAETICRILDVPRYAKKSEHRGGLHMDHVKFTWSVLCPTIEQYEEMFDLEEFIPY